MPTNADLLSSDLVEGEWTEPTLINIREAPDVNPAWPHLVADGDRLVVVWSIYRGTTAEEMKSAVRVEWSSRPLDASSGWSTPQTLYVREGGDAGGRLIDLAADPRGGAVVVYGLFNHGNNDLMLQRLDSRERRVDRAGADRQRRLWLSAGHDHRRATAPSTRSSTTAVIATSTSAVLSPIPPERVPAL